MRANDPDAYGAYATQKTDVLPKWPRSFFLPGWPSFLSSRTSHSENAIERSWRSALGTLKRNVCSPREACNNRKACAGMKRAGGKREECQLSGLSDQPMKIVHSKNEGDEKNEGAYLVERVHAGVLAGPTLVDTRDDDRGKGSPPAPVLSVTRQPGGIAHLKITKSEKRNSVVEIKRRPQKIK